MFGAIAWELSVNYSLQNMLCFKENIFSFAFFTDGPSSNSAAILLVLSSGPLLNAYLKKLGKSKYHKQAHMYIMQADERA